MKTNDVSFYYVELMVTWLEDCPMCKAGTQIHLIRELAETKWITYERYNGRFWTIPEEDVDNPEKCRIDEVLDNLTDEMRETFKIKKNDIPADAVRLKATWLQDTWLNQKGTQRTLVKDTSGWGYMYETDDGFKYARVQDYELEDGCYLQIDEILATGEPYPKPDDPHTTSNFCKMVDEVNKVDRIKKYQEQFDMLEKDLLKEDKQHEKTK